MLKNILLKTKHSILFIVLFCSFEQSFSQSATVIPQVNVSPESSTDSKKETAAVQIVHISRKKIATSSKTTLSGLLQEQSIIRLINNSDDSNQIALSLRGFGDNAVANTLILVDGFPLTNPSLLAPNFNAILLSNIQQIDIFEGSEGTLWGSQAVGGVVDIITRHPQKFLADINLSYGSYNRKFYSAIVGNEFTNGIFFKLSGFTNKTDNYRVHNQQLNESFASQLGIDYARGLLSINQAVYNDLIYFPGALTEAQFETDPRQATNNASFGHYKTQIYQLLSKHEVNDNWLIETRLAHNGVRGDGFIFFPFNRQEWTNSINPQLVGTVYQKQITLGYNGQASNYKSFSPLLQTRASAQQNDVYVQTVFPLFEKFALTLGGRSAWQDNQPEITINQPIHYLNHVFVTEQGLTFRPTALWKLFVRRDGNFRFPKANEEVWLPINATTLQAQTGVSYEAGVEWENVSQKTQVSVYHLQLNNEIAFDPTQTPLQPFGAMSNLAPTLRRGVTITEHYNFIPALALDGQLNYVDARFIAGTYNGNVIPAVAAWSASAGLHYEFLPHWRTAYTAIYTGNRYASEDIANVGKKNPGYWLNNVAMQYFFKWLDLNFEVDNLFNQPYAVFAIYNTTTQTNSYYPGQGRSYSLIAKIHLG